MTRKDYVLLAAALENARPWNYHANRHAPGPQAWLAAVCGVADALGRDNARFDPTRFLTACGVQND